MNILIKNRSSVVQCIHSMHKALGSTPQPCKNKKHHYSSYLRALNAANPPAQMSLSAPGSSGHRVRTTG
jgi:hypothetical protein